MFESRPGKHLYLFLRVDSFDKSVYEWKYRHNIWWRNGSASYSGSEGSVFESRPGQILYQFLRVDAFDIILIVISAHARRCHHKAWWRNGSAYDPSFEGCA